MKTEWSRKTRRKLREKKRVTGRDKIRRCKKGMEGGTAEELVPQRGEKNDEGKKVKDEWSTKTVRNVAEKWG